MSKHYFPKTNRLHKIFNNNAVKVSCISMNDMPSIISSQNKRLSKPRTTGHGCTRGTRGNCSLQYQCLRLYVIYRADQNLLQSYKTFKEQFRNHTKDSG